MEQISNHHVRARQIAGVRKGHKRALSQIERHNCLRSAPRYDRRVAALSASALEDGLSFEIIARYWGNPIKELLLVIPAQVAPARPLLRKPRSRLDLYVFQAGRHKDRHAVANRKRCLTAGARQRA